MSESDETFDKLSKPLPGSALEDEGPEEEVWPEMDDTSPTLSTDTAPSNTTEEHTG